jgi:hypothetical protein
LLIAQGGARRRLLDAGFALSLGDSVAIQVDGISAEVLPRQTHCSWKFIIDNSDILALLGS